MINLQTLKNPVIFFDGVCNLCTGSVQFIIKHDPKHYFRFASLQSELGKQFLQQNGLSADTFDSFIVWEQGKYYTESTAALRVARKLNGPWPGLYVFILLPAFIRNSVYRLIARNRYRWFGKKEACWVPTPELNGLFISR
ncbi:MAG: thiol-disulfide oxidoreductase DCC family protein [Bacteroidetes bacterium]|nr:thiol-disulfide oxidoreductase DCC family protein [Bacteroidota bacterium]